MNAAAPVLTPTGRVLTWCLHLLFTGLLVLVAARALAGDRPQTGAVLAVVSACAVTYAAGPLLPRVRTSRQVAAAWLGVLSTTWLMLVVFTSDGVWVAFPLFFLQLHLLPRRTGLMAVVATAFTAIAAFSAHAGVFSPAIAIGPALGAAVAVAVVRGYQALYRESERRRHLIEELTATRADLAEAQHTAGVLAERERLAHEIHDTLAQGLSSILLLLGAAGRSLPGNPANAARHVDQARQAAADNLAEARRFVAALTPPALDGTSLAGALERLCATTGARHSITARFHLTGVPTPLPTSHEVALLRIAQAAIANTVRHARAATVEVGLSYFDDEIALDVADDGIGFDPTVLPEPDPGEGGFGLAAMHTRTRGLGGSLDVRSSPGHGTAVATRLPLPRPAGTQPGSRR